MDDNPEDTGNSIKPRVRLKRMLKLLNIFSSHKSIIDSYFMGILLWLFSFPLGGVLIC